MRLDLDVDVDGGRRPLGTLVERLEDPIPLLTAAGGELREIERERFRRSGPGWAKNKRSTIVRKKRAGHLLTPLRGRRTGPTLMRSLTVKADPAHIERASRRGVLTFGTRVRAANLLRRKRPFLTYDVRQSARVSAAVRERLMRDL